MENDRKEYRKYCDNCRYEGIEPPSFMDWLVGENYYAEPEVENLYDTEFYPF